MYTQAQVEAELSRWENLPYDKQTWEIADKSKLNAYVQKRLDSFGRSVSERVSNYIQAVRESPDNRMAVARYIVWRKLEARIKILQHVYVEVSK